MILKWCEHDQKLMRKWSQNDATIILKWCQNDAKIIENDANTILKWCEIRSMSATWLGPVRPDDGTQNLILRENIEACPQHGWDQYDPTTEINIQISRLRAKIKFWGKNQSMSATWLRPVRPNDENQNSNFAPPREILILRGNNSIHVRRMVGTSTTRRRNQNSNFAPPHEIRFLREKLCWTKASLSKE